MSTLAKQVVSVFFGATDQDKSKKGIKIADLVTAHNVEQIKLGELTKRLGFTETTQTYPSKASITPDGFGSPDGTVQVVRDSLDDVAYSKSTGATWVSKGGTQRLLVKTAIRFPSTASGTQTAPMLKQAGNWFVWLDDETHFRYAQQSADGTQLLRISDPIAVAGPAGTGAFGSTHVKSFCLVNDTAFDANNLWVYWVDWSTNAGAQQYRDGVWAMKIPINWDAPTQVCITAGTSSNLYILTGISATWASSAMWLAQCGVYIGRGGGSAVDFRSSSASSIDGFSRHMSVNTTGSPSYIITTGSYTRASNARSYSASGVCWFTSAGYAYQSGRAFYGFWSQSAAGTHGVPDLVLVDVATADGTCVDHTVVSQNLATSILPAVMTSNHSFVGNVTGRETSTGCAIYASLRVAASNLGTAAYADIQSNAPDRIFTQRYDFAYSGGASTLTWTKRGAWIAHGIFTRADGNEFIITGWHDSDETQLPYHLRRASDGEIVTQFLYGEAAYAGGCGASAGQLQLYVSDIQQPYLVLRPYVAATPGLVLATTSANVNGTVDMSALAITRPTMQSPASFRGMLLSPGGIPTVVGGWQNNREAGPLVSPSEITAWWGKGSS